MKFFKVILFATAISAVSAIVYFGVLSNNSSAADGRNFNAGRIIDDAVFTNSSSMSVQDIQNFLSSKVTCDTWGQKRSELGGGTRAQWMNSRGISAPFRCVSDYYENSSTGQNNYSKNEAPAGSVSAAQIIYNYSKQFNINPQVLIVTLQKENGLITDEWPTPKQYSEAMGFGCPDNVAPGAPACDPSYGSFSAQIYQAARHFRGYIDNKSGWWVPFNTGNNQIMWNTAPTNCGSGTVNIQNRSTVALYSYTPYQPNQAALNAGYGLGNGCSAYGNRNFYLYFTDWFGSTYSDAYNAQFNAQSPLSEPFYPGEPRQVFLQYKNNGSARWYDDTSAPAGVNPVHLAASVPTNRQSAFSYSWPSSGRPNFTFTRVYESNGTTLAANQHIVEPGQIAKFEFTMTPPWNINLGTHREHFQPVLENAANWSMSGVAWLDITVVSRYSAAFHSQSPAPRLMQNNDVVDNFIMYKNSGTAAWYDSTSTPAGYYPTNLVTAAPFGRNSQISMGWPSKQVASNTFSAVYEANGVTLASNQHIVMPGQIGRFSFKLAANANVKQGSIREYLQPIISGSPNPEMGALSWVDATVDTTTHVAQFAGQSAMPTLTRGAGSPVYIQYKNNGSARWYDDTSVPQGFSPVHLAASAPTNRQSVFSYSWPSEGRPNFTFSKVYEADGVTLAQNQHVTEVGQIARFEFNVTAPWTVNYGTHREYFQPVLENANNWNMGGVGWLDITVKP